METVVKNVLIATMVIVFLGGFVGIAWLLLGLLNSAINGYRAAKNRIAATKLGNKRFDRYCEHMHEVENYLNQKYGEFL